MMRRLALLLSLLLAAVIGLAGPAGAADPTTTMHGAFTSGTGTNTVHGDQTFGPSGDWNVTLTKKGPVVTGVLSVAHGPCDLQPCPFVWPLSAISWEGSWVGNDYVLQAPDQGGAVVFDFTLTIHASGSATLDVAITGCPYGWTSWHFIGPATMT